MSPASRSLLSPRVCSAIAAALALSISTGCAFLPPLPVPDLDSYSSPSSPAPPGSWKIHRIDSDEIRESSGLVKSRTHPGVFWTHNDSGDAPRLFAITARGEVLAEFRVKGASHHDWEDIAIDDDGYLWIGDIGNNGNRRRDLAVHRVPEPDPASGGGRVQADRTLAFRYADQAGFPDMGDFNFDAEAMFWMEGALYVFTKHRNDFRTRLYRLPTQPGSEPAALSKLASFDVSGGRHDFGFHPTGNVTGADLHAGGNLLALLTYRAIFLFERVRDEPRLFREARRIDLKTRRTKMAESIAWDGDALLFGNEAGDLFRIPDPLDPTLAVYPP